jgi:preprotein translocase subunit SecG
LKDVAIMLAAATFWKVFASLLFILVCVLLIVVVLLQRGRGGGLSGAFGGAGGHSAFGAKTGDFFTWLTVCLAGLFLLIAIINNYAFRKVTVDTPKAAQPAQMPPGAGAPAEGVLPGQPPPPGQGGPAQPGVPVGTPPAPTGAAPPANGGAAPGDTTPGSTKQ